MHSNDEEANEASINAVTKLKYEMWLWVRWEIFLKVDWNVGSTEQIDLEN